MLYGQNGIENRKTQQEAIYDRPTGDSAGFVQTIYIQDSVAIEKPKAILNNIPSKLNAKVAPMIPNLNPKSKLADHHSLSQNFTHRFFSHFYGPFLLNNGVRAIIVVSYMFYIVIAVIGSMQFREGLEPSHLVTANHYIAHYFDDMKLFWRMGNSLYEHIFLYLVNF